MSPKKGLSLFLGLVLIFVIVQGFFLVTPAFAAIVRYEETNPAVTYTGTWSTWNNSNLSSGSEKYSKELGASATLSFTGTSVSWITAKSWNRGKAKVYIDGVLAATVDLYSSSLLYQQVVYTKTGLSNSSHTLKIEVTGTKNASATDTYLGIDAFDVEVPVVDTTPPSNPTSLTATAVSSSRIDLSWTASTDNVGVAGYKIERSPDGTTGWTQIATSSSTSYSNTGLSSATTYYYRVRAYDAAGNNSGYSNTASATTPVIRYEETNAAVTYTGAWSTWNNSNLSSGSEKYSKELGASATLSFTGTSVSWITAKSWNRGKAKVYIDGVLAATVDLYSSSLLYQQVVYTKTGLSNSSHTLKIEVTGTKNASATDTYLGIDAFDVTVVLTTTISLNPARPDGPDGWYRTLPTIDLSTNLLPAITYYQLDSLIGSWTTYSGTFSALDGEHTLYFYSVRGTDVEEIKFARIKVNLNLPPPVFGSNCEACHGVGSTISGGDHVSWYLGTPHETALTTSPDRCRRCHTQEMDLSSPKSLRNSIKDLAGVEQPVTGNDNSVCFACHVSANFAYGGKTLFEKTKHSSLASSGKALTRWTNADFDYGMCGNCHNPHGIEGTTDYARAAKNNLCIGCHDDALAPAKPSYYLYRGIATYNATEHSSTTNPYNKWPVATDTGSGIGSGGSTSGECINCHNPHGKNDGAGNPLAKLALSKEENLCYGGGSACHALATGSASGINIKSRFTASTDLTSRHEMTDSDQATSGSKVECTNCHNAHINSSTGKIADPDNSASAYTSTVINPSLYPKIVIQPGGATGKDSTISSLYASSNYGTMEPLWVGRNYGKERSLLQFDLSKIPSDSVIVQATLALPYLTSNDGIDTNPSTNPLTINVHQVLGSWSETGVTWNNQPLYDLTSSASSVGASFWTEWDLTGLVSSWFNNPASNYGVILVAPDAEAGTSTWRQEFYSSDNILDADDQNAGLARRPKLIVQYFNLNPPTIVDEVNFCLTCHDGSPPQGVTVPNLQKARYTQTQSDILNIANYYLSSSSTGDVHGARVGVVLPINQWYLTNDDWSEPDQLAPYYQGMGSLPCSDCHDPHGSTNVYHLKETVNEKTGITVTNAAQGTDALGFCQACHMYGAHNAGCFRCHFHGAEADTDLNTNF